MEDCNQKHSPDALGKMSPWKYKSFLKIWDYKNKNNSKYEFKVI
jgi:hypothetical protein